ncbi:hypothetical protein [Adhaeretor mobilis]|uniref:Uncharacterized protein n=1 Tax=Adhaeretor mobilis TaxID=1930276 RepID=A0A517MTC6_9BACT|nr:hypothetical protein [Adhaeretor mobilis]QDS98135.1 hypothetical protein HG15A2_14070 [Adhaeretor mobilis]
MIHYTCDSCKKQIDPEQDVRYVVRLEVYASLNGEEESDDDRDHLEEIQDILESLDVDEDEISEEVYHKSRYDLCSVCRERYLRNPLGCIVRQQVGFSKN